MPPPNENLDIVRRAYAQAANGDHSWAQVEDFELVTSRENPDAGTYRGDAGREWIRNWTESFDAITVDVVEMLDAGDRVFAEILQRVVPRGGGTEMEQKWWQVVTVRDGVIVRLETFGDRDQALESAGLEP